MAWGGSMFATGLAVRCRPLRMGNAHSPEMLTALSLVARVVWAKSPTAAGGGCREGDFGAAVEIRRSEQRACEFRVPQEGDQSNSLVIARNTIQYFIEVWRSW